MKIVFEKLTRTTDVLAAFYLLVGHEVYCLSVGQKCKNSRLLTTGLLGRKVKVLDLFPLLGNYLFEAHRLAFENVEQAFDKSLRSNRAIRIVNDLYESSMTELAFKKELIRELFQFYLINHMGNVLQRHFRPETFCFIPSRGEWPFFFDGVDRYLSNLAWLRRKGVFHHVNSKMIFPLWLVGWNCLMIVAERVFGTLKVSLLIGWMVFQSFRRPVARRTRKKHRYGLTVIAPERQFANDVQSIEFLVDGQKIKKDEILVIASHQLGEECKRALKKKQLAYVEMGFGDWRRAAIIKALRVALKMLRYGWSERRVITHTAFFMLFYYCKWDGFVSRFQISHLVTYCDMDLQTIPRNIILKKHGVTLWYYMDSVNFPCSLAGHPREFSKYLHYRAAYLYYDYFISWSDHASDYFKLHRQAISNYITVGCLWAEHTIGLQNGSLPNGLRASLEDQIKRAGAVKVLGVFDSSFVDGSLDPYEDGISFLTGILKLLESMPEIFVIVKEKKSRALPSHPRLFVELYHELEKHPRCHVVSPKGSASAVIAMSDLIIAFPYTSVGFEALSVGKRIVFFEPSAEDGVSLYDSAPGLVCRGYEQVEKRVRELLWSVSEDEYQAYLDRHVRGRILPDSDCRALTRFRDMLASSDCERHQESVYAA